MNQLPDAVVASRPTATVGCYTVPDSDRRTGRPDMLELSALAAASIEQVQVHRAALHCMDGFFGAVVPHEHHDLK